MWGLEPPLLVPRPPIFPDHLPPWLRPSLPCFVSKIQVAPDFCGSSSSMASSPLPALISDNGSSPALGLSLCVVPGTHPRFLSHWYLAHSHADLDKLSINVIKLLNSGNLWLSW